MKYSKGYKYRLEENLQIHTDIFVENEIFLQNIKLTTEGILKISKGYSWDGASGPTFDTKNTMLPALVHDALYELMRKGLLRLRHRQAVDSLFYKLLRQYGMGQFRAGIWYRAVKKYAVTAATKRRKIYGVK